VEHPVTEMVTGLDLVKEQILLAMGNPLTLEQQDIPVRGAAIEARILAEDPNMDFLPSTGQISYLREPGGPGIRIDSALYPGIEINADYDSLLAKVIVWGESRDMTLKRLVRALDEYQLSGISTDLEFLKQIIKSPKFITGDVNTTYLEEVKLPAADPDVELEKAIAIAAAIYSQQQRESVREPQENHQNSWLHTAWSEQM
jgi:acetyl/propionyl-CoA carboxylase alpha subunit